MTDQKTTKREPPVFWLDLLSGFCPPQLYEGIEGDVLEQYELDLKSLGERKARWRLAWNVIKFFRPGIILRNKISNSFTGTIMIGNYFKIASRNIAKRKLYSFINAFGLSIGIAFCVLIYLFIMDEKSFDQFHENKSLIYRIEEKSYDTWQQDPAQPYQRSAWIQTGMKQALKDELPEIQYGTRYNANATVILKYGDKMFTEKNLAYVDGDFFRMFSFRLIAGNKERIFENKSEIVLTQAVARKYFGDEDPIGKTMELDDQEGGKPFTVTGIIEAPPANSSLEFGLLIPQENRRYYEHNMTQWGNFNTPTFVQLVSNTDLKKFSQNLDKVIEKYMGDRLARWRKESMIPVPDDVKILELEYTQLPDIHMKKEIGWRKVSDPQYSFILGGIALLILSIACINYISLSLTTSTARRTEVGIRKVVGAQKNQLVYQFGFESLLLALISMVIGIGLVVLFLPAFNEFTAKGITLQSTDVLQLTAISLAITVIVGVLAGSYPALFLSRFRPALVLKGGFTSRLQAGFTKPLVVLQFALSAFLIISSIIMHRQMGFVTTKDLGYDKDQVVVVPTQAGYNDESNRTVERFRTALQQNPTVVSVAGVTSSFNQGLSRYGFKINGEQKSAFVYAVDSYYIPTLGLELVEGRNFDPAIPSDTNAIIVNEALVRDMKWTDPLNEYYNYREDTVGMGAKVIGVVKDYHFLSLESAIEPMFLSIDKKSIGYLTTMLIKISAGDIPAKVDKIASVWKELKPDKPFDYSFLDDDVAEQYQKHTRWMNIMSLSTGFAIMIACLGLFGLSGINAVNRTKEIGIRKALGAELTNIFILLNRQYVLLALIAFAVAAPASWYVMTQWWLKDFKFKVTIGWELFAASMLAGLFIALLTVSYHAIKAALVNPADTLKYE